MSAQDPTIMAESARFVALGREANRLLDEALDEPDTTRSLELLRQVSALHKLMADGR